MKASLKIWQKGLILALLPFAFNLIWIGLFFNSVERASTWINKAESQGVVIVEVANSIALLSTIFFDLADYVDTAGSAEVKTKLKTDWQQLNDCYARLDGLTKDDPEISAKLNRFAASLQEHMANSKIMDGAFAASTFNKELADTLPEKYCKDSALDLKELIDLLSSRQERFRTILESEELERDKTRLIANLGLLANIILAALIAVFFQKNLTARISRL